MDSQINDSQVKVKVRAADLWWAWATGRLDLTSKDPCTRVGKEGSGYDERWLGSPLTTYMAGLGLNPKREMSKAAELEFF